MRNRMIIQIYEIQTPQEAQLMVELGVDHVGSVLISEEQWRDPQLHSAIELVRSANRKSSLIPLFGNADTICRAIDYYQPHIMHFCETLPPTLDDEKGLHTIVALQKTIRERYPQLEIMRSIPIGSNGNSVVVPSLEYASLFEPWSDWFLTDTLLSRGDGPDDHDQPVTGFVGVTGITCDWDIAGQLVAQCRIPVILAGGMGPDNVAAGIAHVKPAGVDSCTMTNVFDDDGRPVRFQKDPAKVRSMVERSKKLR